MIFQNLKVLDSLEYKAFISMVIFELLAANLNVISMDFHKAVPPIPSRWSVQE